MIGVAVMIVGSAVSIPIPSTAVTNTFELIFIFSLFLTQRHLVKYIKKKRFPCFFLYLISFT